MKRFLLILIVLFTSQPLLAAEPEKFEEEVRRLASELRCVVCQNLSVAASPSEMAQQMRGIIREQLQQGKTPEQIKAYFVSKYGEWVLLAPSKKGFSLLLWVLPFVALAVGLLLVVLVVRSWVNKKNKLEPPIVDPELVERVRREAAEERPWSLEPTGEGPQTPLQQELARLYSDLKELEFDYQAGKLSETDYSDLRKGLETQAAMVLKKIGPSTLSHAAAQTSTPKAKQAESKKESTERKTASYKGWQVATGGIFLLIFGVTLGVLLTQSLRPRMSEEDSITGDFLTGTGPGGLSSNPGAAGTGMGGQSLKDLPTLLSQGRVAYQQKELRAAIAAFKGALEIDPNQPEALSYMGWILTQAGHADDALIAFNRALLSDPNFPDALLGKGMLLYRVKEDFSGARQTFEKLVSIMPPGPRRDEIQKTVAELDKLAGQKKVVSNKGEARSAAGQIQGVISVDPKLKIKVGDYAVLFIIARSSSSGRGPPLAVKKVTRPSLPLSYALGSENVMMPGVPFSGKVFISVRLDKDGNAMTKEPGNLKGEHRKNPVEVGSRKIDIVIDQIL